MFLSNQRLPQLFHSISVYLPILAWIVTSFLIDLTVCFQSLEESFVGVNLNIFSSTIGRLLAALESAFSKLYPSFLIRYAIKTAALRLTP